MAARRLQKAPPPQLAQRLQSLQEAPAAARALYDHDPWRDKQPWFLTPAGKLLAEHRKAVAEDDGIRRPIVVAKPGKEPRLSARDWGLLLGTITPDERAHFIREAAAGRIRVDASKAG